MARLVVTVGLFLALASCLNAEAANEQEQKLGRSLDNILNTVQFGAEKVINFAKSNGIHGDLLRQASGSSLMTIGGAVLAVILVFVVIAVIFVALYPHNYTPPQYGRRKRRGIDSETLNMLSNIQDDQHMRRLFKSLE